MERAAEDVFPFTVSSFDQIAGTRYRHRNRPHSLRELAEAIRVKDPIQTDLAKSLLVAEAEIADELRRPSNLNHIPRSTRRLADRNMMVV